MEDLILRKAEEAEFPGIRRFYDAVIDGTRDMNRYAKWKKGSHPSDAAVLSFLRAGDLYLCTEGGQTVSVLAVPFRQGEDYHAVAWEYPAEDNEAATLHLFAVSPARQGKGIGRRVLTLAMELAARGGCTVFRLDALASNLPAHRLYESMGFRKRGTQHLYTDNAGWVDFWYYEKLLK